LNPLWDSASFTDDRGHGDIDCMKPGLKLYTALFAWILPVLVYAIGLGEMKVESALEQPFRAEVQLFDVDRHVLSSLRANMAIPETFEHLGIERVAILSLLNFKIENNRQGMPVIIITSKERMTEPYMQMVIDLVWPNGQLYKVYTVLLDPSDYHIVNSTAQSSITHYQNKSGHEEVGVVHKTIISEKIHHKAVAVSHNNTKETYGPTINNESVWQIAQRYKTPDLMLSQVVLAIVGANPSAFQDGNLNGLKVGIQLNIPTTAEMSEIAPDIATEEVMAHDKAWNDKTAVNHVINPPYINGEQYNQNIGILYFEVPPIPKFSDKLIQTTPTLPAHNNQNSVTVIKLPHSTEEETTTRAELSITSAAVDSMRSSNAALNDQMQALKEQNKKLQEQLNKRDKEMDEIRAQLKIMFKERKGVPSQGISAVSGGGSFNIWSLLLLLFAIISACGMAWWYFNKQQMDDEEIPVLDNGAPGSSTEPSLSIKTEEKNHASVSILPIISDAPKPQLPEEPIDEIKSNNEPSFENIAKEYEQELPSKPSVIDTPKQVMAADEQAESQELAENKSQSLQEELLEFESGLLELFQEKPPIKKEKDKNELSIDFEPVSAKDAKPPQFKEAKLISEVDESKKEPLLNASDSTHMPDSLKSKRALDTLLDLAKTYISMQDFDSARQSLEEVLKYGTNTQKEKAKILFESIK
jgi:pilus assembly protein FimV